MAKRNATVAAGQADRISHRLFTSATSSSMRNDIFGDGVNIAVRLEGIAEPGGVCISDDAQASNSRQGPHRL
jgi:adenylate cyclase